MDANRKPFPPRGALISFLAILFVAALVFLRINFPTFVPPLERTLMPSSPGTIRPAETGVQGGGPYSLQVNLSQGSTTAGSHSRTIAPGNRRAAKPI